MATHIVLLPDLVDNRELRFDGWYKEAGFTVAFSDPEVKGVTTLYGKSCVPTYIVILDVNGGEELAVKEIIFVFLIFFFLSWNEY